MQGAARPPTAVPATPGLPGSVFAHHAVDHRTPEFCGSFSSGFGFDKRL